MHACTLSLSKHYYLIFYAWIELIISTAININHDIMTTFKLYELFNYYSSIHDIAGRAPFVQLLYAAIMVAIVFRRFKH